MTHHVRAISLLLTLGLFASCIRPEAPNAEADILAIELEGVDPLEKPLITNTEIKVSVKPWADRTSITPRFTLTPGARITPASGVAQDFTKPVTYRVTSESGEWTKEYTISIGSSGPLPGSYHFDEVSIYKQKDTGEPRFQEFVLSGGGKWASPNEGFMITLALTGADPSDPSVYPTSAADEGMKGKCAKLTTMSTGMLGAMFKKPIAPGTLYLGEFIAGEAMSNPLKTTRFGVAESRRPVMLTGYYKYKAGAKMTDMESKEIAGETDRPDLYAVLFETDNEVPYLDGSNVLTSPNIVLLAQLKDPKESAEWVHFEIPFEPQNGKTYDPEKQYKLTIVATSSREGAAFRGAVGSTLYLDEMTIYFE